MALTPPFSGQDLAEEVNNKLDKTMGGEINGDVEISGSLDMGGNAITNVAVPQDDTDVANKEYVNDQISSSFAENIVFGTYIGNGNSERLISLGFAPKCIIISATSHRLANGAVVGADFGMAISGVPLTRGTKTLIEATSNGFKVFYFHMGSGTSAYENYANTNGNGIVYSYIAFK